MSVKLTRKVLIGAILCPMILFGCATQQGNDQLTGAGMGAAGGAALGCLAGALLTGNADGCAKGAVIGGVAGAAVGWGTVRVSQYNAEQVRSTQKDQQMYGLAESVSRVQVKIRQGISTPRTVKPGETIKVTTDYSVILPTNLSDIPVVEAWQLQKDNKLMTTVEVPRNNRQAGGWSSDAELEIPKDAPLGTYVILHRVQAGSSYDVRESVFVVAL